MAQLQVSRTSNGTNMPSGATSSGPISDTFSANITPSSGTIASLGTTLTQIVSSTANTVGAGLLEIFIPGGTGGAALLMGNSTTTANAVNLGSGRTWYSVGFTPGTSNIYIAASTGTIANVTWEIK
ncbi:MAG TPA: hypothetical protein VFW40_06235 [Capsulimonadaceae bacterium]|nr:hypothetical protein [Capsulimonadaceae bacterium]